VLRFRSRLKDEKKWARYVPQISFALGNDAREAIHVLVCYFSATTPADCGGEADLLRHCQASVLTGRRLDAPNEQFYTDCSWAKGVGFAIIDSGIRLAVDG
jgi:hypothetical protein